MGERILVYWNTFANFIVITTMMKTLTLNIPEEVDEREVKMAIAAILFDKGVLSSGQAAEFAAVSKRTFIENVGKYGVSIFGETADDLKAGSFE